MKMKKFPLMRIFYYDRDRSLGNRKICLVPSMSNFSLISPKKAYRRWRHWNAKKKTHLKNSLDNISSWNVQLCMFLALTVSQAWDYFTHKKPNHLLLPNLQSYWCDEKYCYTALNTLLVVVSPCCTYQRSSWQDFDESSASTPHWTHSWSQPSSVWVDVRTVFIWIQQMFAFFADSLNFTRTFVVTIS